MKTLPYLLSLMLVLNVSMIKAQIVSEKEKVEITRLHQNLISEGLKAWESMNIEKVLAFYANHPDFSEVIENEINHYEAFKKRVAEAFQYVKALQFSDTQYSYTVLSPTVVLCEGKGIVKYTFTDTSKGSVAYDYINTLVSMKIGKEWKVIHSHISQKVRE